VILTRRVLLLGGASVATLVIAGCDQSPPAADAAATPATPAGPLTGAPVTATSSEPLMNPKGLPDRPIGGADAKVTVIEYASPTCPHCAAFHTDTYPAFKAQYIDTGKVKFILRPFVRNVLDGVVFMLAEAAGDDKYHEVVDTYFKTQAQWAGSDMPREAILAIAMQLGFTAESFDAALTNQELFNGMETLREQALNEFNLTGTPQFYINGKAMAGEMSIETLSAEIDPLLA
jgi:protein-disulfide isomerase